VAFARFCGYNRAYAEDRGERDGLGGFRTLN
jgi:hypothetical protein